MKMGDWLIVSGVVLVPLAISIACGIWALVGAAAYAGNRAILSLAFLAVGVAVGLTTAGILLRKNNK